MKTNLKHTEGPWMMQPYGGFFKIIANGDTLMLPGVCISIPSDNHPKLPEAFANAHLIAAAPELLEAIKRVVPWLGKMIVDGHHLEAVAPNDAIRSLQMAEAAISKATTPNNESVTI